MHCYLQKVELISHWTEAGSQRIIQCKSRYNYFQAVFWVLGLTKPLTESFATIPLSETFGPKTSYLQSALPRAPTSSTFPVKPIRCVTAQAGTPKRIYPAPKRWQPGAGCPQKNSSYSTYSGFLLWNCPREKEEVQAGWTPSGSPFQGYTPFACNTAYVHKMWFYSREELQHLALPSHHSNFSSWRGWVPLPV